MHQIIHLEYGSRRRSRTTHYSERYILQTHIGRRQEGEVHGLGRRVRVGEGKGHLWRLLTVDVVAYTQ